MVYYLYVPYLFPTEKRSDMSTIEDAIDTGKR